MRRNLGLPLDVRFIVFELLSRAEGTMSNHDSEILQSRQSQCPFRAVVHGSPPGSLLRIGRKSSHKRRQSLY